MDKLALAGITAQFGNATVLGVAGTTVNISVATTYAIRGKMYSKAISNTEATPTTDANTGLAFNPIPKNYASVFVLCLDSAGAVKAVQGRVVATDGAAAATAKILSGLEYPAVPDTLCPISVLLVKAGSDYVATTTGWLLGTHNTTGVTGVNYTFTDVSTLPDRPTGL